MALTLSAKIRDLAAKKPFALRDERQLPAVLYGHGATNQNLVVDAVAFEKVFKEAGENTIIDLAIDGQAPVKVLIADTQYETVKNRVSHIDFKQIRMDEKITAHVDLNFTGESRAVKEEGGVLVHGLSELEIRCLPQDLLHEIDVDISVLTDFDSAIHIKDLAIPASVEIVGHEPEDVVANIARVREEKEEAPAEATTTEGAATEAADAAAKSGEEEKKAE